MDNRKLNQQLRTQAINLGLCQKWQNDWQNDWSQSILIDKYKEGIDFCLANNFPSNQFIIDNFSLPILRASGIFINDTRSALNTPEAVIKGGSYIKMRYNARHSGTVYIADNAHLQIRAHNDSFVLVHVYGTAEVEAFQQDNARLVIIRHSRNAQIVTWGNSLVKEEILQD